MTVYVITDTKKGRTGTAPTYGGAENDGHEIAGHEIDGPSCRA